MSLSNFWISVGVAARSYSPAVMADSPLVDTKKVKVQNILKNANMWLTPGAVAGFASEDFDFLSSGERSTLTDNVDRFRRIAEQVPQKAPIPDQLVQEARPAFQSILGVADPDKYADLDAFVLGKRIEQATSGRFPSWVQGMKFATGHDAIGDPAVWVYVEVEDDAAREEVLGQNAKFVRETIDQAMRDIGDNRWPYVHFTSTSDRKAMKKTR